MSNIKTSKKKHMVNKNKNKNKNKDKNKSKSNKSGMTKKNIKKLNILLDIDETLLQFGTLQDLHHLTDGPHNIKLLKMNRGFLVFLRPFVSKFLDTLFKNFNVGFWTNASTEIAVDYLEALLTPHQKKQVKLFIARDEQEDNYYDFKTKKNFTLHSQSCNVKKLSYLFNSPIYKHQFNEKNTLLIDDNPKHYAINRGKNVIFINEFHKLRYCDDILPKISKILMEYNKKRNINLNKTKLPNYATINTNFDSFNIFNKLFMGVDECSEKKEQ